MKRDMVSYLMDVLRPPTRSCWFVCSFLRACPTFTPAELVRVVTTNAEAASFRFTFLTPTHLVLSCLRATRDDSDLRVLFLQASITHRSDYPAFVTLLAQTCGPRFSCPLLQRSHHGLRLCLQAMRTSPTTRRFPQTKQRPERLL
jgi:hypothetical protein